MSRPWLRWVQALFGLAVLLFLVRTFSRNWADFRSQSVEWRFEPLGLLGSVALVWAMYALLIAAWRAMLVGWGQSLPVGRAARIWVVSSLGKYVPGKIWAIAGMALMAEQEGVTAWAATASAIILQALAVGTGALIAALTGSALLGEGHAGLVLGLWALVAASIAGVGLLCWPPLARRVLPLPRDGSAPVSPPLSPVLFGVLANLVAWIGYGAALWLLARSVLPGAMLPLPAAIAAFAASYVAGLVFLLAPGGLGVREGILILMLQASMGLAPATALAVASRLLLTLTEVGAAVPFLLHRGKATGDAR